MSRSPLVPLSLAATVRLGCSLQCFSLCSRCPHPPSPRVRGEGRGGLSAGLSYSAHSQRREKLHRSESRRGPLTLAPRSLDLSPHAGRGEKAIPFSRRAFAPEFCLHAVRKPFMPPFKKKGGGAPISASTGFRPAAERESLPAYAARASRPCPALARDQSGGALAFRRPTAVMRRGLTSTRLRAALPGITGSKREDPLRHQCSQHLAVRSRAGRSMPKAARNARCMAALPGTALVPLSKVPSRKAPP